MNLPSLVFNHPQEGDDAAHFMRTQIMQGEYDKETKRVGPCNLRFSFDLSRLIF
jgi:hypothetical protein